MKKYMIYSFGTLWTVVLIVALVATVIHQAKFQDSPGELNLNNYISRLKWQNQRLSNSLDQQAMEHAAYREWVMSWR